MTRTAADRALEQRIRRAADRQGYRLHKSGRRDPRAIDYNTWWLIDATAAGGPLVDPPGRTSMEAIAAFLDGDAWRERQVVR